MADELTFPDTVESDSDDVSWALETGRSMWAQGDHKEGIKWLKRAAESASEEEDDMRSLELAKAAADLRNFVEEEQGPLSAAPPPAEASESSGPPDVDSIAPLGAPIGDGQEDEAPLDEPTTEFSPEKMAEARAAAMHKTAEGSQGEERKRSLPTPKKRALPAPRSGPPPSGGPPAPTSSRAGAPPAPTPSRPAPPAPTPSRPAPPAPTPSRPAPPASEPPRSSPSGSESAPPSSRADDDSRPTMIQPMRSVTGAPPPARSSAHRDAIRVAIAPDPGAINAWLARPLPDGEDPRSGERLALLVALDEHTLGT